MSGLIDIIVYNELGEIIGEAKSYAEVRRMHIKDLNKRGKTMLQSAYAGMNTSGDNFGFPLFYLDNEL